MRELAPKALGVSQAAAPSEPQVKTNSRRSMDRFFEQEETEVTERTKTEGSKGSKGISSSLAMPSPVLMHCLESNPGISRGLCKLWVLRPIECTAAPDLAGRSP